MMLKRLCMGFLFVLTVLSYDVMALDLELTQGVNAAIPIGIGSFGYDEQARAVQSVVANDLRLFGQFKLINEPGNSQPASLSYWQRMRADSVLTGKVVPLGDGRVALSFDLIDAAAQGRLLLHQKFVVPDNRLRALAHHISDQVYKQLTGERGVFSTKIAYIMVQHLYDNKTRYSLEVADMDGYHPQSLLISSEPIMSPAWSPDGHRIAYVSFERKRASIFEVDVATGRRRLITDFPGINGAPAWSPDGRELAVVLSKSGAPKIYTVNISNGSVRQITFGSSIDTEPRYAPDGRSILFTSGRGGTPQVYRLNLASGQIPHRLTYDGNYNARASYTPDQQSIVMLHREDKDFNIAVQPAQGGSVTVLTHSAMDESPSVSPNGRVVLYATRDSSQGVLEMVSIDGRTRLKFPSRDGDIQEPAWSPFLS